MYSYYKYGISIHILIFYSLWYILEPIKILFDLNQRLSQTKFYQPVDV